MQFLAINPIIEAYLGADWLGKIIFLLLVVLSFITWALLLQKHLAQKEIANKGKQFLSLFQRKKMEALSIHIGDVAHPFALLLHAMREKSRFFLKKQHEAAFPVLASEELASIRAEAFDLLSTETAKMEKNLFVLSTIVSLAPFLGLLGTVWGILLTFAELRLSTGGQSHATVMNGLAMALGTTVVGLLVAIPALIGYNYLRASIATLSTMMEEFTHLVLASLAAHYQHEKK